jgi:uncharacterized RDD family membrane protein YckC
MTEQTGSGWVAPAEEPGPAPGYVFGGFGARLIAYLIDGRRRGWHDLIAGTVVIKQR